MKPLVDYDVAATVDPNPINLFTPGPDYARFHDTWLEDKWLPFMGFVLGAGSQWYYDSVQNRRPFYSSEFLCYFNEFTID